VPAIPGVRRLERLANGLTVCLVANRQAPIVTTALWYRAGTRDEPPGHGGVAHFLEHMMFKGTARHGPGEIDRLTQALGGSNNAFTSHDATAYWFNFARDRWREALAIEADRMAGLALDPGEVASERQVILEEIAMYDAEPWDALGMAVEAALYPGHPYGRPVLGTREELAATGAEELAAFHRRRYRPDNAVLVVAGDLDDGALRAVEEAFGGLAGLEPLAPRPAPPEPAPLDRLVRVERRRGEVPRLLLALRGPAGGHPDHAAVRLLVTVLGSGRSCRLNRVFVDEGQLCVWAAADLAETVGSGPLSVSLELLPGVDPDEVEQLLLAELEALAGGAQPVSGDELERARRVLVADWVFAHERVHQQAVTAGFDVALFDPDHHQRELDRVLALDRDRLAEAAARYLTPERGGVLGRSLPRSPAS
jgi:zinc protease